MVASPAGSQTRGDGGRNFRRENDINIAAGRNVARAIDWQLKMFTSDAIWIFIYKKTGFPIQLTEKPGGGNRSAEDAEVRRALRQGHGIATNSIKPANS